MTRKLLALLLALSLAFGLAGCGQTAPASSNQSNPDQTSADTAPEPLPELEEGEALEVGCSEFAGQFSPFYAALTSDRDAVELTQIRLLTCDRAGAPVLQGIEGEIRAYNGTDYTYYGPANLTITEQDDGTVWYDFTLRENLTFSDGEPVTVDDLIFSLYVLLDPSYEGPNRLNTMPVQGLAEYQSGDAPNIAGLQRTGEFSLRVVTDGLDVRTVYYLGSVYIAPLHYYGDETQYDYEQNSFGFSFGDLTGIQEKTDQPLGAGPYRFLGYEIGEILYEANDTYYLGAPQTQYLRLHGIKDMAIPPRFEQLISGLLDLGVFMDGRSITNQPGKSTEGDLTQWALDDISTGNHIYIGINPATVCVGGEPGSEASKNLRRAFATVLAACRQPGLDQAHAAGNQNFYQVIDYPVSDTCWAVPGSQDPAYTPAYTQDVAGNALYQADMTQEERISAAAQAALGFFRAAGYTVSEGKVTSAPEGASLSYEIQVNADLPKEGEEVSDPLYLTLIMARDALAELGVTLEVVDTSETGGFPDRGNCDMWVFPCGDVDLAGLSVEKSQWADWYPAADPDVHLNAVYGDGEHSWYHLEDPELKAWIREARSTTDQNRRAELYAQCLDRIMDWACEVPLYQDQNALIFNHTRIDATSLPADMTGYYGWMQEVQNLRLLM